MDKNEKLKKALSNRKKISDKPGVNLTFPLTTNDMKLKELSMKLDREIWAHVPNPLPPEDDRAWTQSKAREETSKLVNDYFGSIEIIENENRLKQQIIDGQRKTLSDQYDRIVTLENGINELLSAMEQKEFLMAGYSKGSASISEVNDAGYKEHEAYVKLWHYVRPNNNLWDEAHLLMQNDSSKSQTEHYMILLKERRGI